MGSHYPRVSTGMDGHGGGDLTQLLLQIRGQETRKGEENANRGGTWKGNQPE